MLYKFPLSSLSFLQPATTTATNPPAGVALTAAGKQQCKQSMLYMCNNLLLLLLQQTKTKSMSAELSTLFKFALIAVVVAVAAAAAVGAALFLWLSCHSRRLQHMHKICCILCGARQTKVSAAKGWLSLSLLLLLLLGCLSCC